MADILFRFPIQAPVSTVFEGISTPQGLDAWWTKTAAGKPAPGEIFSLFFEPDYNWTAIVSQCVAGKTFELTMLQSDSDWQNSKVGFILQSNQDITEVEFYHTGWKENNTHYRITGFCWAMYLRLLKRHLEYGEIVPYAKRLEV